MNDVRLSNKELAKRWGQATKTLDRWRVLGIGPVFLRLPGKVVYRLSDVEAYEQKCLRKSTSEAAVAGGEA